jgi:hypothetical protein
MQIITLLTATCVIVWLVRCSTTCAHSLLTPCKLNLSYLKLEVHWIDHKNGRVGVLRLDLQGHR